MLLKLGITQIGDYSNWGLLNWRLLNLPISKSQILLPERPAYMLLQVWWRLDLVTKPGLFQNLILTKTIKYFKTINLIDIANKTINELWLIAINWSKIVRWDRSFYFKTGIFSMILAMAWLEHEHRLVWGPKKLWWSFTFHSDRKNIRD